MKILTHNFHTGRQFEMSKMGHEWFICKIPYGDMGYHWNFEARPKPKNVYLVEIPSGYWNDEPFKKNYDVKIIHYGGTLLENVELPVVYNIHITVFDKIWFNQMKKNKNSILVFNDEETRRTWLWKGANYFPCFVIEHSIDLKEYKSHKGHLERVLFVGNHLPTRPEKNPTLLYDISKEFSVKVCGKGNEKLWEDSKPAISFKDLKWFYKVFRVFFNPSEIVCGSVFEAMGAGMPVVQMEPKNKQDIFENGINCFIVKNKKEAIEAIKYLMENPEEGKIMGKKARMTIAKEFNLAIITEKWNNVFDLAIKKGRTK